MTDEMLDNILLCPSCRHGLAHESNGWRCDRESIRFENTQGIPDFILDSRRPHVEAFLKMYQAVRRKEGWGSKDQSYYMSLPEIDTTKTHAGIWKIRSQSYRSMVEDMKRSTQPGAKILDLGAGNGWLSYRLAVEGYEIVAADVNLDTEDGLLAPTSLSDDGKQLFVRIKAEFDHLPFADHSFDAIVFNASVHYSRDPVRTVRDTLRFLSDHGVLYILDSPCYDDPNDGIKMLGEKTLDIESKTGQTLSDDNRGSFLGPDFFGLLKRDYEVNTIEPHSRIRRLLRRVIARVLRRRTPASFSVVRIQKQRTAAGLSPHISLER